MCRGLVLPPPIAALLTVLLQAKEDFRRWVLSPPLIFRWESKVPRRAEKTGSCGCCQEGLRLCTPASASPTESTFRWDHSTRKTALRWGLLLPPCGQKQASLSLLQKGQVSRSTGDRGSGPCCQARRRGLCEALRGKSGVPSTCASLCLCLVTACVDTLERDIGRSLQQYRALWVPARIPACVHLDTNCMATGVG